MNHTRPAVSEDTPATAPGNAVDAALARLAAREDLNRVERLRLVAQLLFAGHTQQSLGALLGVSQPTVHRLARQARNHPNVAEPTPIEIIHRATVGEISRDQMLATLRQMGLTPGQSDPTGHEGYARGTWDQVEDAVGRRLLTEAEYDALRTG